ncbi:hypothetical protein HK102_000095 [Quaeritorhiza haematococci]|nr:hypothetical protein HK102_000095 [Quaeritorhiza haematococci]
MTFRKLCSALALLFIAHTTIQVVNAQQFTRHPGCNPSQSLCIFPPDGAEFLQGSLFDVRVEHHTENTNQPNPSALNDLEISIHREGVWPAPRDFNQVFKTQPHTETWNFTYYPDAAAYWRQYTQQGYKGNPVGVISKVWRNLQQSWQGTYTVTVKAGGETVKAQWHVRKTNQRKAKNVILAISDGTTTPMISALRVIAKSKYTKAGKYMQNKLNLDLFPEFVGHIIPNGLDSLITDSANSASAYSTGHKAPTSALGVYGDTSPSHFDDPKQELVTEVIRRERPGMAVGIVTTAEVQDATPAAFYGHTRWRDDKDVLTDQLLRGTNGWGAKAAQPDVVLGGGGKYFHGKTGGASLNKTDYYQLFQQAGYTVLHDRTSLVNYNDNKPLLGIFHQTHLNVWMDRTLKKENLQGLKSDPTGTGGDALDQPSLIDMTMKALDVLKARSNGNGFFLMVEAASVDKQNHLLDTQRAMADLLEMDQNIGAIQEWLKRNGEEDDTLLIFTADHGHGFDVYGTVDTKLFNEGALDDELGLQKDKRAAIGVYEFGGWPTYEDTDGDGFIDNWDPRFTLAYSMGGTPSYNENFQTNPKPRVPAVVDEAHSHSHKVYVPNPKDASYEKGLKKPGNIPVIHDQGVHSLQDVPLFARGPGSNRASRIMDNNELFFVIAEALGLGQPPAKLGTQLLNGLGGKQGGKFYGKDGKVKRSWLQSMFVNKYPDERPVRHGGHEL